MTTEPHFSLGSLCKCCVLCCAFAARASRGGFGRRPSHLKRPHLYKLYYVKRVFYYVLSPVLMPHNPHSFIFIKNSQREPHSVHLCNSTSTSIKFIKWTDYMFYKAWSKFNNIIWLWDHNIKKKILSIQRARAAGRVQGDLQFALCRIRPRIELQRATAGAARRSTKPVFRLEAAGCRHSWQAGGQHKRLPALQEQQGVCSGEVWIMLSDQQPMKRKTHTRTHFWLQQKQAGKQLDI